MKQPQPIGGYVLQFQPLQLLEGRRIVDLTSRQLMILAILVRARGRVVTKEVFFEQIWRGVSVEEGNLTQSIFLLRRALGKLSDGQEYILTLPRKGYCINIKALQSDNPAEEAVWTKPSSSGASVHDHYRMLVESVEDCAMYMLDCTGRVVTWNSAAEVIQGFTHEEILGQHYSLFFTPEELEAHLPRKQLTLAAREGRVAGEAWRLRKSGERFWASVSMMAVRNAMGNLVGFTEVVRDLTERKRSEDARLRVETGLRRERDQFRAAADRSFDPFFVCEPIVDARGALEDFVLTYLNRSVRKITVISGERFVGDRAKEVFPPAISTFLVEAHGNGLTVGSSYTAELELDESAASYWVRVNVVGLGHSLAVTVTDLRRIPEAPHQALPGRSSSVLANQSTQIDEPDLPS